MTWFYLASVLIYLVALAALGIWRMRGAAQTSDDFIVAGRTLPASVLVFTLLSTWIGSGSLFAGAGLGYRVGLPALWQSAGAWAGIAVIFFLAPRVRRLAQYTVPDVLELRYGSTARVLGAITIVLAYTAIAAYQFRGGGRLLHLIAGLDPATGALITAIFCVLFTAAAGMRSIALLDVVNGLTMLGGVGIALVYVLGRAGGVGTALSSVRPDQLTLFGAMSPIQALGLFLPTMCLLLGEANMYQKFFSARDERAARLAVAGWIAGTIAVESMIVGLGLLGSTEIRGLGIVESETIVVRIATDVLPLVIGAILLAACAAIIVSTANSMLLSPATNLVRDIYQRLLRPAASAAEIVLATRIAIAALGALGLIAGRFFPTVLSMALWAYTMYGAGITPALIAALVWPRATRQAGTMSIAAGMLVTLLWEFVALARGSAMAPNYLLGLQTIYPALVASVGTLILLTVYPDRLSRVRDPGVRIPDPAPPDPGV
jgi:SSS family solute:Na+ symporter/sodium/proline symporter